MTALLSYYLEQRFSINWIEWLNGQLVNKWMNNRAYYKTQYVSANLDNPDQRIQQDVQSYVRTTLSLSIGVIDAVTSIISYTILLWGLAGPMMVFGTEIPRMMVFFGIRVCDYHYCDCVPLRASIDYVEFRE